MLDGDGYVNLQEYLDEVGAFPAPTPLTYVGPTSGPTARYALITNWKTSDYTTTDARPPCLRAAIGSPRGSTKRRLTAARSSSMPSGSMRVRYESGGGTNPTLIVSSGWLKVENDVVIGGFGVTGELNLTGGTLRTKTINKASGGAFNFSGGKLSADTINFSLTNNGGTLAPGDRLEQRNPTPRR